MLNGIHGHQDIERVVYGRPAGAALRAEAERLGARKVRQILATDASELVTANIGCTLQIQRHLRAVGKEMPVRHVVEILDAAYLT